MKIEKGTKSATPKLILLFNLTFVTFDAEILF